MKRLLENTKSVVEFAAAVALVIMAAGGQAQAAIIATYYTGCENEMPIVCDGDDRDAFEAAVGDTVLEDFESFLTTTSIYGTSVDVGFFTVGIPYIHSFGFGSRRGAAGRRDRRDRHADFGPGVLL